MQHLFNSFVWPHRVRVQVTSVNKFKKVMSSMSLAPVVFLYQGDLAPFLQATSHLESHAVPLGAL